VRDTGALRRRIINDRRTRGTKGKYGMFEGLKLIDTAAERYKIPV